MSEPFLKHAVTKPSRRRERITSKDRHTMNLDAAIPSFAVTGGVSLILYWLMRSARRSGIRVQETGELVLRFTHPFAALVGIGGAALPNVLVIHFCLTGPTTPTAQVICAAISGLSVLIAGGAAHYLLGARIRASAEGVTAVAPFLRPRAIRWGQVTRVRLAGDGALTLVADDKTRISVEPFMVGILQFEKMLARRLPLQVRQEFRRDLERFREFLRR